MAIPSENKRNDYTGNGAVDTYPYTFKITSESDIKVSQRDTEDVETVLTLNVDYTVTGVGALNGGSIVLTAGNLTTDYHLTIRRDSELTQQTDIRNQGDFLPEVHEDTFDHLASVDLTQQFEIDRSVKVSETYPDVSVELPGPQAGRVLKWNDAGTALINVDTGDAEIAVPADDSVTPAKIQSGLPFVFPETLVLKRGADVASAAALPVINDGNYVDVTGSDAITSIDSIGIGTWLLVQFDAALTLTHHGTNLFLPANGSDIITAAGDHALFAEYGIGVWRCVSYIKANGQPIVLTGITFTNPVLAAATLNTSVAGTAFQDDDSFGSAAPNKFASSESIKEYVDVTSVTNGDTHDHSGGDGATIGADGVNQNSIAASSVGQGELKTAQGEVSTTGSSINLVLPGGEYGFYPRVKTAGTEVIAAQVAIVLLNNNYVTNINLDSAAGDVVYAQQRYFQASPPYKIGSKEWGHFLYMLVNAQGDVIASYEAEDPPYAYNGPSHHAKDSIERIQAVPHPFADYHDKDPAIDGLEIVLVDLRKYDTKKWKFDNAKKGKGILEDMGHINKKGKIITPQSLGITNIQGFTDKVKIRKHN